MSKPIIVGADIDGAANVDGGKLLKQSGVGVLEQTGITGSIGISESRSDNRAAGTKDPKFDQEGRVGVIKQGIVRLASVNAAYNFGDTVELASGGQSVQGETTGEVVGTAVETKTTTTADNLLSVYVNFA